MSPLRASRLSLIALNTSAVRLITGQCVFVNGFLAHLVIFAMPVDHPVLPIGADLQLECVDVVSLLSFFGNGTLGGDACKHFQSVEVNLLARKKTFFFIINLLIFFSEV